MTIVESNKMIAKFMGAKFATHALKGTCWLPTYGVCNVDTIELGKGKILEYHKSWDWLIPVVEKIEKQGCIIQISFSGDRKSVV